MVRVAEACSALLVHDGVASRTKVKTQQRLLLRTVTVVKKLRWQVPSLEVPLTQALLAHLPTVLFLLVITLQPAPRRRQQLWVV